MEDHDILTIDEVAVYLRVSERTVYDWANKGTIPCGKLGTTWRFKRTEVQRWVDEKLSGASGTEASQQNITLQDVLRPERILFLDADTKQEALDSLVNCLGETSEVSDVSTLRKEIFNREDLMSTGIGFNIAVPHVRLDCVKTLVMCLGICRQELSDYASLDEQPVRIICMLAARPDQHALYLKTLGVISATLKSESMRQSLLDTADPQAAFLALTQ